MGLPKVNLFCKIWGVRGGAPEDGQLLNFTVNLHIKSDILYHRYFVYSQILKQFFEKNLIKFTGKLHNLAKILNKLKFFN